VNGRAAALEPAARPDPLAVRFSPTLFAAFVAAALLTNYPGRLNIDALEQLLGTAVPAHLNDWHAPIVGWLWQLPAPLLGQPGAALLVQSLLIGFGVAVIPAVRPANRWAAAALLIDIFWKAALVPLAGTILKDVLLVGALLTALAAFRLWLSGQRRLWLWIAAAAIALATLVRAPNAIMFCVAAALGLAFFDSGRLNYRKRLALVIALLLACVGLGALANRYLFGAHAAHPEAQVVIFDIAGTSVHSGSNLFERMPGWPAVPLPALSGCYEPFFWDNLAPWGRCRGYSFAVNEAARRAGPARLARWWAGELVAHPLAYGAHRLSYLGTALTYGITDPTLVYTGHGAINGAGNSDAMTAALRERLPPSYFSTWREDRMPHALAALLVAALCLPYAPAAALCVCLLLAAEALYRRKRGERADPLIMVAAAVGLGNVAMMAVFGAASSPRYFFPLILGAYVAATERIRRRGLELEGRPAIG